MERKEKFGFDVLVVGAGIFGLTIAERLATQLNKKVLVVDKRDHIGGNSYSEKDSETGIEVHKYGAHLFHTSIEEVWNYVNKFTDFTNYVHRVYTTHDGVVYHMPINLDTINKFYHANYNAEEAENLIREQTSGAVEYPKNLYEQGVALMGEQLFNAFIRGYTEKQWQISATELPPEIIKRIPVRFNYDDRYFSDKYEGLPVDGYAKWFENMVKAGGENIVVRLGVDYFGDEELLDATDDGVLTIYTGPIDRFFGYKYGELQWRSLEFVKEVLSVDDYQGCPVMNFADLDVPYTRALEFKHFHPEREYACYAQGSGKTVVVKEYSKTWERGEEPYYPVGTGEDMEKLKKYLAEAGRLENVYFGGRLGEYKYYDMDKTFESALRLFEKLKTECF